MQHAWRPMRQEDLHQVMQIAAVVHAGYFEAQDVFAERLALFAAGCWIAESSAPGGDPGDTNVVGYMVMHPVRYGWPPALNTLLQATPSDADSLHLHDIALLPSTRGGGLGRAAVDILRHLLREHALSKATLVAVHASSSYWHRFGFRAATVAAPSMLDTYGADALFMQLSASDASP